ncbi:MAG: NADH-quinone oxidoreductase subunit J [Planctomycetes bacterium]|nr:NADH-quinone oxidoreductase subunit J [Planctomycetota bacterium]
MTTPATHRLAAILSAALAQAETPEDAPRGFAAFWMSVQPYLIPGAMVLGAIGLWLLVGGRRRGGRLAGAAVALGGFVLLGLAQEVVAATENLDTTAAVATAIFVSVLYWLMAGVTVIAAGATISMRSPVYSAVCFAVTLLGVAGLFLLTGAQFLSIATVAVYAGAIVVTFLFVVMLAQPEGQAYYDRISWGRYPPLAAAVAAALLIGGVAYVSEALGGVAPAGAADVAYRPFYMADLGRELFSVHLISVEIVGTLLLIALVGAIAIVIQGRDPVIRHREYAPPEEAAEGGAPDRVGGRRLQPAGDNGRE